MEYDFESNYNFGSFLEPESINTVNTNTFEEESELSESEIEEEELTFAEELESKIKELLLFKVELPSSASNKLIISALDAINDLVEKAANQKETANIFDVNI